MNNKSCYASICRYVPESIRRCLEAVSDADREKINEIRLRVNRPVSVTSSGKSYFVTKNGGLTAQPLLGVNAEKSEISEILKAICSFSVHSYTKELSQGYITIENGVRAGIAGTAVQNGDNKNSVKYINALNFRIPRQVKGCAEMICSKICAQKPCGIIICGGVSSGKTTLLRDICRILGNRFIVSLVDERGELAGCSEGVPGNDVGAFTDVLDGYSRSDGIISAIRSLSPEVIMCDEISTDEDSKAILSAAGCGVRFIATAHCENADDLKKRHFIAGLIESGIFDYAVIMAGSKAPGVIKEIRRIKND